MTVQHVIRGGHSAFGPAAELGHQRLLITAVQGLAVGLDVGAGNAFEGDDQYVAGLAAGRQQRCATEVELAQAGNIDGQVGTAIVVPGFQALLAGIYGAGQEFVWQVELPPLIGLAGAQVFRCAVAGQQQQWQGQQVARVNGRFWRAEAHGQQIQQQPEA